MAKPVMVLDGDTDQANRFRLSLVAGPNGSSALPSLVKVESQVWALAEMTGVPKTVMAIGKLFFFS